MQSSRAFPRLSAWSEKQPQLKLGPVTLHPQDFVVCAGPCSVESEELAFAAAKVVRQAGGRLLRGGASKFRTSPYDYAGPGLDGARWLHQAAREYQLATVVEPLGESEIAPLTPFVDLWQVGARNMYNVPLLQTLARSDKPVLLKRGMMATTDEFLCTAERLLLAGCRGLLLCERGLRSFDPATRNLLDLAAVAGIRQETHLPVWVDPSHGTGQSRLVSAMCRAAIGAGATGLLVEIHPSPAEALSDGAQALSFEDFTQLMQELPAWVKLAGLRWV